VPPKPELLQGTLDLMVLKTLEMLGPLHGFGVARRIEQLAANGLELNHGTVYPALVRLEQQGWITSSWGASENNRRARFYALTKTGQKRLVAETESWLRTSAMMTPFIDPR
jgi:PadR family transcriptional regulator, regulatory protein PadR